MNEVGIDDEKDPGEHGIYTPVMVNLYVNVDRQNIANNQEMIVEENKEDRIQDL